MKNWLNVNQKRFNLLVALCLLLIVTQILTACGFEIVDTGYRGVETRFGKVVGEPLGEGLHFYNPFTTDITEYGVREQKWEQKTAIFTRDTQQVDVEFAVVYYPDPKHVHRLYQEVGQLDMLEEKIIRPVVLGSIKDAIGEVIADELVSKRELVTKAALKEVKENLSARSVIVSDLQFTNLDFDNAYEQAVEQKVVAIQQAQKAKNDTVTIQEKARQTVFTAEAEAQAMKIKSEALSKNQSLIALEWVNKWKGEVPGVVLGGGSTTMVNLSDLMKTPSPAYITPPKNSMVLK